jgi:MATE family multidrug resistance protein
LAQHVALARAAAARHSIDMAVETTNEASPGASDRAFAVTNRTVLGIAVPMTLAYLTTPLLGIVDTAVVGQMGDAALLGGLAIGALAFDFVFASFSFLRTGTTGLVAQAFGRGEEARERAVFWRAIMLAVGIGLVLTLATPLVILVTDWFVAPAPAVSEAMAVYVGVRMLAAPVTFINYVLLGYVLGRGQGSTGLTLQLVVNGGNIVFSIVFGLWLGWGIAGVAWGTVTGEVLGALVGSAIVLPRFRNGRRLPLFEVLDAAAFRAMMALNRDIMIRTFVLVGAFALLTQQGAKFGTVTLAANAVLMNFFLLAGYFLDGFAAAAEQLAGRAIGARHAPAFHRAVRLTAVWGFGLAGVTSAVLLVSGDAAIALITTSPEVRAEAMRYLPWAALTAVSGVLAFQMDGVFIGATWSRDMRNMMLLSFAIYVAALWSLGVLYGNHGLWAALHIFLVARGLSLFAVMRVRAREAFA